MLLQVEREQVVEYGRKCIEYGITVGTFGNMSVFNPKEKLFAISPTGMDYTKIRPADVVILTPEGEKVDGDCAPSSEVDMHRIFYQRRPGINACIHTHSIYATTLACLQWSIEPIHYVIAYGGRDVPCIPYVQFGTYELAEAIYDAMGQDHYACLLGNHGLVCVGQNISYTFDTAEQVEFLAHIYYNCRVAGGGVNLTPKDLDVVVDMFKTYRKR